MSAVQASLLESSELRQLSVERDEGARETELSVPGMHCGGCINRIEKSLSALDGVQSVRVNLSARRVRIHWDAASNPQKFVSALSGLGFDCTPIDIEASTTGKQSRRDLLAPYLKALAVSGFAAGNVMMLSVSVWSGADTSTSALFHWISAFITVPAVLYSGQLFFRSAGRALRQGHTNMDVPISIGILLTCSLGLYDTVTHQGAVYFEAALMLIFFLLIGRTLDHVMRQRAGSVLEGLRSLEAAGVDVIGQGGARRYVPTEQLVVGDVMSVQPDTRLATDGVVVDGISDIDTSIVNGESQRITAATGTSLYAGSLNVTAPLNVQVTKVAGESFLASIQQLVQFTEASKGRYQSIADRAARWYAPVVHVAALLAFLLWFSQEAGIHQSITIAVSVLIITCPCALALAVPMVQVVAGQRLFEHGVLMKSGAALERLSSVDTVVLDKTGTLTETTPTVANADQCSHEHLLLAAALCRESDHPFARAIVAAAASVSDDIVASSVVNGRDRSCCGSGSKGQSEELVLSDIQETPGQGVEAWKGRQRITLGKAKGPGEDPERPASELRIDGVIVHRFEFDEMLRKDAEEAVDSLQRSKLHLSVLSGDTEAPVKRIAERLSIGDALPALLPADKVEAIEKLQTNGHSVLMVGDGLNDSGALAAATASMAPGDAATTGRNSADFVFLSQSLNAVPLTLNVANKAQRLVKQNIAIALIYNAIALPFAFAGAITPLIAAAAMSASSLIVVANAMRLRWQRIDSKQGLHHE